MSDIKTRSNLFRSPVKVIGSDAATGVIKGMTNISASRKPSNISIDTMGQFREV